MGQAELELLQQQRSKRDRLCPDQEHLLEPHGGELDVSSPRVIKGSPVWCLPSWLADSVPSRYLDKIPPSCSQHCSAESKRDDKCTVSVGISGLSVFGDGLIVLPAPCDPNVFDPRTWLPWKPVVEILGMGSPVKTTQGQRASPANGDSIDGSWCGLAFGEPGGSGVAAVAISSDSVLRFRVLRVRPTSLLSAQSSHSEEAFTANLHMQHDFFAQGCPKRLVRPIFYRNHDGDIRHVGHLHVSLRLGSSGGATSLAKSALTADVPRETEHLKVPQDYPSIQAALDVVVIDRAGGSPVHVVVSGGIHHGDVRICKRVVLEGPSHALPVIHGNITIESGGEQAEIRHMEVRGFIAVHAGAPLISGCTVVEAGLKMTKVSGSSMLSVAAVTVSGNGVCPIIESNNIRQSSGPGVLFENGALGTLRDNTVSGNTASGVEARDFGTKPTVEGNKIFDNQQHGIFVHYGASGTFANNDVHRNKQNGIMLQADTGAGVMVRRNRVHENEQGGIVAEGHGDSTAERDVGDNEEIGPPRPP